jgi:hypothetical protein
MNVDTTEVMSLPFIKPYHKTNTLNKQTCLFIPKGPKFFACFTYVKNKPCCLFIDTKTNIKTHHYVCFKEELSLGTLLYGTLINNNFVCEHIYSYKNEKIDDKQNKLELIKFILQNMIKDSDVIGSISFKIPHMVNNSFILEASNLPYQVYGLVQGSRMFVLHNILGGFQIKKRPETEDVYELFTLNDENQNIFYSTALVNDFKTSHYLKTLFYKKRLTYKNVEFSDSEDDTCENEEINKNIYVGCLYISEFKKWKPYTLKNQDSLKKILFLEKNNIVI